MLKSLSRSMLLIISVIITSEAKADHNIWWTICNSTGEEVEVALTIPIIRRPGYVEGWHLIQPQDCIEKVLHTANNSPLAFFAQTSRVWWSSDRNGPLYCIKPGRFRLSTTADCPDSDARRFIVIHPPPYDIGIRINLLPDGAWDSSMEKPTRID